MNRTTISSSSTSATAAEKRNENNLLTRKLEAQARIKLSSISDIGSNPAYIIQWETDDIHVIGIGCAFTADVVARFSNPTPSTSTPPPQPTTTSLQNTAVSCRITLNMPMGLYVFTQDYNTLNELVKILNYKLEDPQLPPFRTNGFKLSDLLFNYDKYSKPGKLVKIVTENFYQSVELFNRLKYDPKAYKYALVPEYWNPTKFVMFETLILKYRASGVINVQNVIFRWFDHNLSLFTPKNEILANPQLPMITFDIETVSSEYQRIPTGEDQYDILFTSSIHHIHTNTLYTLVYLPISGVSCSMDKQNIKRKMLEIDEYPTYSEVKTHIIEVYNTEYELLDATLTLLDLPNKVHYLVGYNSMNYDIKYLIVRAQFFNMNKFTDKFIYRDGFSFGFHQFHMDLFRMCKMLYDSDLKDLKLGTVAKHILNDSKTGVDAHNLRFSFFRMMSENQIIPHSKCTEELPCIRDILHYNNYDTLLVGKIINAAKILDSIINDEVIGACISITSINTYYDKMQYRALNAVSTRSLNLGLFFGKCKPTSYNVVIPALHTETKMPDVNNYLVCSIDLAGQLLSEQYSSKVIELRREHNAQTRSTIYSGMSKDRKKEKVYAGGVNYCRGEYQCSDIQAYDYRIAYSYCIDKKNISDETTLLIPANLLYLAYLLIPETRKCEFETYDYKTHMGKTKSETRILIHKFVNYNVYCGSQFPFTAEELIKRNNSFVVLIWVGQRGILSETIRGLNDDRENKKSERNKLNSLIEELYSERDSISDIMEENQRFAERLKQQNSEGDQQQQIDDDMPHNNVDSDDFDDFFNQVDSEINVTDSNNTNEIEENITDFDFGLIDNQQNQNDDENEKQNEEETDFNFDLIENSVPSPICGNNNDDDDTSDPPMDIEDITNTNKTTPTTIVNYKFSFIGEYIDENFKVDTQAILNNTESQNPSELIQKLIDEVIIAKINAENKYTQLKILVSSIYGCIGSIAPDLASIITYFIRSTLLSSAQFLTLEKNCTVYYCDTDSMMLHNPNGNDYSSLLNYMHPHTDIEMKKMSMCYFIGPKTYYKLLDDKISYSQHKNGSPSWHDMVDFFFHYQNLVTDQDILLAFKIFFTTTYKMLSESLNLKVITKKVSLLDYYSTDTNTAVLKRYIAEKYPFLNDIKKIDAYYYYDESDVNKCVLRPILDLKNKSKEFICKSINLYKFYSNIYMTVYNVIKFKIKESNHPYVITLDRKAVQLIMLRAFLDTHDEHFKR